MTYAVYITTGEHVEYIGDVSAPNRDAAVYFLAQQGYMPGTYELFALN